MRARRLILWLVDRESQAWRSFVRVPGIELARVDNGPVPTGPESSTNGRTDSHGGEQ